MLGWVAPIGSSPLLPAPLVPPLPGLQVRAVLTFFGRLRVTRVIPSTRVRCSFSMAFRAFFSLREWMTAVEPAGALASPASISESSLLSSSCSSTVAFLGSSSGSSSTRGFAILAPIPWSTSLQQGAAPMLLGTSYNVQWHAARAAAIVGFRGKSDGTTNRFLEDGASTGSIRRGRKVVTAAGGGMW